MGVPATGLLSLGLGWATPRHRVPPVPCHLLQYVRLSQDTPPSVIYHLMTQYWGLDVPNLLISVTGGAKDFNMKPRLKSVFRRGLVKVAQTTGSPRGLKPWGAEPEAPWLLGLERPSGDSPAHSGCRSRADVAPAGSREGPLLCARGRPRLAG